MSYLRKLRVEHIFIENAGAEKGVYKIKVVKQEDVANVKAKLSQTFRIRVLNEKTMERNKARWRKLEEESQSQLNARELYDSLQRSSSSLMVSVIASAQQRADHAVEQKRRKR